jgi:hypothetical protein
MGVESFQPAFSMVLAKSSVTNMREKASRLDLLFLEKLPEVVKVV